MQPHLVTTSVLVLLTIAGPTPRVFAATGAIQEFDKDGVLMPLRIDGQEKKTLRVLADGASDSDPMIEAEALLEITSEILLPELQELLSLKTERGGIRLSAIRSLGLEAKYLEDRLEIELKIPSSARREQTLNFWSARPDLSDADRPTATSAYLNMFATKSVTSPDSYAPVSNGGTRDPLRAGLDGAVQINGTVLESQAQLLEGERHVMTRGDTRLVRDDTTHAIRYSLGDLRYPLSGLQSFRPMGGMAITREFSITPYDIVYPTSRTQLELTSNSSVDVVVNGAVVRSLRLSPGRYDLRDLPLPSGLSDVELRIVDEFGRRQTIRFPFIADTEFLKPGRSRFNLAYGLASSPLGADRVYYKERPTLSAFEELGITDRLTLGLSLQSDPEQQLGGMSGIVATPLGVFAGDLALSRKTDAADGTAARLRYRSLNSSFSRLPRAFLNVSLDYRSREFTPFDSLLASNPYSHSADSSLSLSITDRVLMTVGGGYQVPRDGNPDGKSVYLAFNTSLRDAWTIDLNLSRRSYLNVRDEDRVYVNLIWTDSKTQSQSAAMYEAPDDRVRLSAQRNSGRHEVGAIVARQTDLAQGEVDYAYRGSRALTTVRGRVSRAGENAPTSAQTVSSGEVSLASALVVADGHVALSRPIASSFALITSDSKFKSDSLAINPSTNYPGAELDGWGPAVLPDLNAYTISNAVVDTSSLPIGTSLKKDRFKLLPAYRSGHHIELELSGAVVAGGRLVNSKGQPLQLKSGEVLSLDKPQKPALEFFTNREGLFVIEGLESGRWLIRLFDEPIQSRFSVGNDASGEIDLGDLTSERSEP